MVRRHDAGFWFAVVVLLLAIFIPIGMTIRRDAKPAPSFTGSAVKITFSEIPGTGSGVHIGRGYIVTAAHVAAVGKDAFVTDDKGGKQSAELLWSNTNYDIALYRIKNIRVMGMSPLSCKEPEVGESIEAIGSPLGIDFGHFQGFVATKATKYYKWGRAFIADMSLNSGISGGAVLNKAGEIVGIAVGFRAQPMPGMMTPIPSWSRLGVVVPSSVVCSLLARE